MTINEGLLDTVSMSCASRFKELAVPKSVWARPLLVIACWTLRNKVCSAANTIPYTGPPPRALLR